MRPRWLSSASIFALVTMVAGGCDRRTPEPLRRVPRVVDATFESLIVDDVDSASAMRRTEELIDGWTPPATVELVRPPPPTKRRSPELPKQTIEEEPSPVEDPAIEAETRVVLPPSRPPAERRLAPPPREQPSWYTPPPRGPHETAIQVATGIGVVAIAMGGTVAAGDGRPGEQAFAVGALGLGLASLSTALVLHLTEPAPKPTVSVTLAPSMLVVRGTF
jgi:hypothetical protein